MSVAVVAEVGVSVGPGWQPQVPAGCSPLQQVALADGSQHVVCSEGGQHSAGLVARTMAECMPGAASWVKVTSASVNPTAASPSRYSVRDRAPAMQPT